MNDLGHFRGDGPLARALRRARSGLPTGQLVPTAVAAAIVTAAVVLVGTSTIPFGGSAAVGSVAAAWAVALIGSAGQTHPRLQWPVPALLRALEYLGIVVLAGAGPWTFGLLGALAFHHYDVVYRLRGGGPRLARWVTAVTGGWDLRLLVVLAASVLGWIDVAVTALTVVVAPVVVTESVLSWWRHTRPT